MDPTGIAGLGDGNGDTSGPCRQQLQRDRSGRCRAKGLGQHGYSAPFQHEKSAEIMPKHLTGNEAELWHNWNTASAALKWPNHGECTTWMYISPDGRVSNLEGRNRGRQGVGLSPGLKGAHHLPFEHLFSESAFQVGSTYERSNINKRVFKAGAILGGKGINSHQYRMIEDNWWAAWPHDRFGWLGGHSRFGGWRW